MHCITISFINKSSLSHRFHITYTPQNAIKHWTLKHWAQCVWCLDLQRTRNVYEGLRNQVLGSALYGPRAKTDTYIIVPLAKPANLYQPMSSTFSTRSSDHPPISTTQLSLCAHTPPCGQKNIEISLSVITHIYFDCNPHIIVTGWLGWIIKLPSWHEVLVFDYCEQVDKSHLA